MKKELICIECPKGCHLVVDVEHGKALKVEGNACPKGETYAVTEVENPLRILTTSVLAEGLGLKMVPAKTDGPIPKAMLFEAMQAVKKTRIKKPANVGDIIIANFLGLNVNLVATKDVNPLD